MVSSPPSPPGVSGGTADTLSWNEMPLPNQLLSQRPRGAAASGSCCFRVPIHPGRVWLGDTKIEQWTNKQAGSSAITMKLLCRVNLQLALKAFSFLATIVVHCQAGQSGDLNLIVKVLSTCPLRSHQFSETSSPRNSGAFTESQGLTSSFGFHELSTPNP